jgi:hypothetical protein
MLQITFARKLSYMFRRVFGHLQGDDDTKEFISTHIVNNDMLKNF